MFTYLFWYNFSVFKLVIVTLVTEQPSFFIPLVLKQGIETIGDWIMPVLYTSQIGSNEMYQ